MAVLTMSGRSVKGAERWLDLKVITLQPSEILKPFFIIITAYLYYMFEKTKSFFFPLVQIAIYGLVVILLFLQPDFGMILT
jgi:cell division protein FtsW